MVLQLRLDQKLFALAIVVVNGAITYLVPLISTLSDLTPSQATALQGFLLIALNGLVVYLSMEEQTAPP